MTHHLAFVVISVLALSVTSSHAEESTDEFIPAELYLLPAASERRIESTSLEVAVTEEHLILSSSSSSHDKFRFEGSGEGSGDTEVVWTQVNSSALLSTSNETDHDVIDDDTAAEESSQSESSAGQPHTFTTVVTLAASDDEDLSSSGDSSPEQEGLLQHTTRGSANQRPATPKSSESSDEFEFSEESSGMVDQSLESSQNTDGDSEKSEPKWPEFVVKLSTSFPSSEATTKLSDLGNDLENELDGSEKSSSGDVFQEVLGNSPTEKPDSSTTLTSDVAATVGANEGEEGDVVDPLREERLEKEKPDLKQVGEVGEVKKGFTPKNRVKNSVLAGGVIGTVFGLVLVSAVILVILKFRGSLLPGRSYTNPNTTETV